MRKLVMAVSIFLLTFTLFAADTLFSGDVEHGGYGGFVLKGTRICERDALFVGGQGGWILNSVFSVGGGGYGLTNDITVTDSYGEKAKLGMGYGGIILQFIAVPDSIIHVETNVLIGAGGVGYRYTDWKNNTLRESDYNAFFVCEPGANLVLNVSEYFRITLGGSYRFISGADLKTYEGKIRNVDLSSANVNLGFNFGKF